MDWITLKVTKIAPKRSMSNLPSLCLWWERVEEVCKCVLWALISGHVTTVHKYLTQCLVVYTCVSVSTTYQGTNHRHCIYTQFTSIWNHTVEFHFRQILRFLSTKAAVLNKVYKDTLKDERFYLLSLFNGT